jgi:predicted metal-dependent enzyme (double-stranded beta helix superfamily)
MIDADRCLGSLVGGVRAAVQRHASWSETAELVAEQLRTYLPGPEILTSEQRYGDPLKYRCHLLHAEPDGSFSVVALVWRPGQATPIHDHVAWCVAGVIAGVEREEQYLVRDDGWLQEIGTAMNVVGEVSALAPPGDIHCVRNAAAQTAISLHVYGTDVSRIGSSVRRVYDLPVIAALPG